ncbi:MAG: HEAT repeat domain-containing protein [Deltaproteobacteria bacterium]|nr:HEAT repeat domain-containing protein [Deltaproteobacteria bacterium]
MKYFRICAVVAAFMSVLFMCASLAMADVVGSFFGTVVDETTGQPIEGAVIIVSMEKAVARFHFEGPDYKIAYAKSFTTDKDGKYRTDVIVKPDVPLFSATISTNVVVYAQGYLVYSDKLSATGTGKKWSGGFSGWNFKLKLKRIPPRFDYGKGYEDVDDALDDALFSNEGDDLKKMIEKKTEWLKRRSRYEKEFKETFDIKREKKEQAEDVPALLAALKTGSFEDKMDALWRLGNLPFWKPPDESKQILEAIKDIVRAGDKAWSDVFFKREAVITYLKACAKLPSCSGDFGGVLYEKRGEPMLRPDILKALALMNCRELTDDWIELSGSVDEEDRFYAAIALTKIRAGRGNVCFFSAAPESEAAALDKKYVAKLFEKRPHDGEPDQMDSVYDKLLNDPSANVRRAVATGLADRWDKREYAYKMIAHPDAAVQKIGIGVLGKTSYGDTSRKELEVLADVIARGSVSKETLKVLTDTFEKKMKDGASWAKDKEWRDRGYIYTSKNAADALVAAAAVAEPNRLVWIVKLLGELDDTRSIEIYKKALANESARSWAIWALGRRHDMPTDVIPDFIGFLKDKDNSIRAAAAKALGYSKDKRAFEPLMQSLVNEDSGITYELFRAIMSFDGKEQVAKAHGVMLGIFDENKVNLFANACDYLKKYPDTRAVPRLIKALEARKYGEPANLVRALGVYDDKPAISALIKAVKGDYSIPNAWFDHNDDARQAAAEILVKKKVKAAVPAIIEMVRDKDVNGHARSAGIKALGRMGDASALAVLDELVREEGGIYSREIKEAREEIRKANPRMK